MRQRSNFVQTGNRDKWLSRYLLSSDALPVHCSATCQVYFAQDSKDGQRKVALKFMKDAHQLEREIVMRQTGGDLNRCVIEVVGFHMPKWRGRKIAPDLLRSAELSGDTRNAIDKLRRRHHFDSTMHSDMTMHTEYPFVLVMEQASASLYDYLWSQRIAGCQISDALKIFRTIVGHVKDLHSQGVVHFDIKPRNILLRYCEDGTREPVLCDLDASLERGSTASRHHKLPSSGYAAPEVRRWVIDKDQTLHADPSLDVWSLGVLLFELLAGRHLFAQDINSDTMVDETDTKRLLVWLCAPDSLIELVCPDDHGHSKRDEARDAGLDGQNTAHTAASADAGANAAAAGASKVAAPLSRAAAQAEAAIDAVRQREARHLVRWCLQGEPAMRPTIDDLLSHQLFDHRSKGETHRVFRQSPPSVGPSVVARRSDRMAYHVFISHMQAEASGEVGTLAAALQNVGVTAWRDMGALDLTEKGMRQGVWDSDVFCIFLTNSMLSRDFCLKEISWALEFAKPILIIVETDARFAPWQYQRWKNDLCARISISSPWLARRTKSDWTRGKLQSTFSQTLANHPRIVDLINAHHLARIPYRRRDFEADAMVREILRRIGNFAAAEDETLPHIIKWGTVLPPSRAEMNAQLAAPRAVKVIADRNAHMVVDELTATLAALSQALAFADAVDTATHVLVLLTADSLVACYDELLLAVELARPTVFVYDETWDFGAFYDSPETKVKATIASHEALVWRPSGKRRYEHRAMALELFRRMHPSTTQPAESQEVPTPSSAHGGGPAVTDGSEAPLGPTVPVALQRLHGVCDAMGTVQRDAVVAGIERPPACGVVTPTKDSGDAVGHDKRAQPLEGALSSVLEPGRAFTVPLGLGARASVVQTLADVCASEAGSVHAGLAEPDPANSQLKAELVEARRLAVELQRRLADAEARCDELQRERQNSLSNAFDVPAVQWV